MFTLISRRARGEAAPPDDIDRAETKRERPLVGFALGGGAARGWAHIGILKTLLKAGIAPDVIAGTSIGAVVGGCHAAGKLDDLEAWACHLTRRRVFGLLDVSLGGSGVVGGERIARLLQRDLDGIAIDALPLPFAAVATELGTGHEIWLTRGRLAQAMRASYSLPGIFPPVKIGGRWLMDGALVNPVPVSAARALGARIVVAVNLNSELVGGRGAVIHAHGDDGAEEEPAAPAPRRKKRLGMFTLDRPARRRMIAGDAATPGLPTVMVEAFNIVQDRIARSRLAGDPPDVLVAPKLARIGLFEFHRAEEAIAAGVEAAERALDDIRAAVRALA